MEPKLIEASFLDRLEEKLKQLELWGKDYRLLIACSGGPDSMALLRSLHALQEKGAFQLGVCTVDHQLRLESGEELQKVRQLCGCLGIPFFGETIDIKQLSKARKGSTETIAREERYRIFRHIKSEEGFDYIVTAHHSGDQAETVLFHLLRGSGPDGLMGVWPKRGDLVRPFLSFAKEELIAYLESIGQDYCIDETNFSNDYTRNRIRNKIIPVLLEESPHFYDSIATLTTIMQREGAYWTKFMGELKEKWYDEGSRSWDRLGIVSLDEAVRYRLYRFMCEEFFPAGMAPTMAQLKAMDHVVSQEEHKEFTLKWMKFYHAYDRIYLVTPTDKERNYRLLWLEETDSFTPRAGQIVLPKSMWEEGVYIRKREAGDRIVRLNKKSEIVGHRILKKVLMEQKVPKQERNQMWFLATKDSVLCAISNNTSYAVRMGNGGYVRLQIEEDV